MARIGRNTTGLGALAALVICMGCGNKDGAIPNVPPPPRRLPARSCPTLQYLAAWKNYKHLILISPISPMWFSLQRGGSTTMPNNLVFP